MATQPVSQEQSENRRERSLIEFPYLSLDDSVEIAKTIHTTFGTNCTRDQLAGQLQVASTGGGFNLRMGTAKMFGLVSYERGNISLTDLGMRVSDPQQEKAARAEAFLNVPLYRALFEKYKGKTLPSTASGLEAEMVTLGVAQKQKDRARQVFQRSAKESGYFWAGSDRLVEPPSGKKTVATIIEQPAPERREESIRTTPDTYPPFIQGLLEKLPADGTVWPKEERLKWLKLAELAFDVMYKDAASEKERVR